MFLRVLLTSCFLVAPLGVSLVKAEDEPPCSATTVTKGLLEKELRAILGPDTSSKDTMMIVSCKSPTEEKIAEAAAKNRASKESLDIEKVSTVALGYVNGSDKMALTKQAFSADWLVTITP
ncbi:MAG: hypothetical protein G01um101456_212 [Parcubacteria group bacterium Gr01-1014_56]|nr:MAG: hypothetical protein G01um101456_212 [Parcubacteria group bacterium Gr01-1014_56]